MYGVFHDNVMQFVIITSAVLVIRLSEVSGRSCGNPGVPSNGLSYFFNDVVYFSCNNCYKLSGVRHSRCLADGTWSGTLPTCIRITCSTPTSLAHGTVRLSSRPVYCGSYVDYECSIGYNLRGRNRLTCLGDGSWSSSKPTCEIVDCGDPGHPQNGQTTAVGGFTYGNDITFSCDQNFVLEGSLVATCQSDGTWSMSLPKCLEKCSDPSGNTNAQVIGKNFYHSNEVEFICPRDSILVPSRSRKLTCQDGEWQGTIPSCKASCPPLPRLSDGSRVYARGRSRSRTHGSVVQFRCTYGHKLVGSSSRTCNDGSWSNQMPRCLAICRAIQSISYGSVVGRGNLEGAVLRFSCRTDYVLDGARAIRCTGNRRWNATKPVCRAPCSRFSERPFFGGYRERDGFRHNEEVVFGCNDPLVLDGQDTLRCNNGRWSDKTPSCAEKCSDPSGNTNAYVIGKNFYHSNEVEFICPRDSILVPSRSRKLTCQDGEWQGTIPSCKASCPPLPRLSDGSRVYAGGRSRSRTHGSVVQFRCTYGHKLVGSSSRTCNDGSWSNQMPRCLAICRAIQSISYGSVVGRGNIEGAVLRFSCRTDYVLDGARAIRCTGNRRWNATKPACREKCSDPSVNTNAQVIGKNFYHGNEVEFICPRDSILVPSRSRKLTCRYGEWQGTIPSCKALCPSLPRLSDGYSVYARGRSRGQKHGSIVQFRCAYGHKLVGSSLLTCNDGSWSNQMPKCLAICRAISRISYGSVVGRGNLEGAVLHFSCRTDYVLDGARAIRCTGNRRWNATKPVCRAPCARIGAPTDGSIRQGGFRHNERRHFECQPDYYLQGSGILTCVDGRWSGSAPTCLAPCSRFSEQPFFGGYRKRDGFRHNEEVVFGCNDPLVLDGRDTLRCNNGRWSDKTPSCAGACRKLTAPTNGFIAINGYKHKETLIFQCRQGFQMVGASERICNFGVWNDPRIPQCKASCPPLSQISNGKIIGGKNHKHGSFIRFFCDVGYQHLHASRVIVTQCNDGKWSQDLPKCLATCRTISSIRNGRVIGHRNLEGDEIRFVCDPNYIMDGERAIRCTNTGAWNASVPQCEALCPPLSQIPNGKIEGGENRKHGSLARLSCNDGYQHFGISFTLCVDGRWLNDLPKCLAICRAISSIRNGLVIGDGNFEGNEIAFVCYPNYVMRGDKVIRCTNTGAWSASEPLCIAQPNNCPDIKNIRRGKVQGSGVSPGSKRKFSCNKGWKLFGLREITCLNNGQWSGSFVKCVPQLGPTLNCKAVGKIQGGFAVVNQTFHGGRVVFSCHPNYKLEGRPWLLCRNGKWSREPPKCYAPCKNLDPPKNGSASKQSAIQHGDVIAFNCNPGYTLRGNVAVQCINGSWDTFPPTCQLSS